MEGDKEERSLLSLAIKEKEEKPTLHHRHGGNDKWVGRIEDNLVLRKQGDRRGGQHRGLTCALGKKRSVFMHARKGSTGFFLEAHSPQREEEGGGKKKILLEKKKK